jgi:hypothetical protein
MRLAWEQDRPASAAPIICSCAALNNIAAGSNRRDNGGYLEPSLSAPRLTRTLAALTCRWTAFAP